MNVDAHELQSAPQLALLAAIDHALVVATTALHAAHPEIDDDDDCAYYSLWLAVDIIRRVHALQLVLADYRAAITDELHDLDLGDEIPF